MTLVLYTSYINVNVKKKTEKIAFQLKAIHREFTEVDIASDKEAQAKLRQLTGSVVVPQLLCNDKLVGNYDECWDLVEEGEFEEKIKSLAAQ